ncbi:GroES-like protein [Paxillus ammoniavirescens]|nr:GroES-like protein [Paxillus ammoniavirescens]
MTSQQQKALFLESKQGKFVVGHRDIPSPGKGQLLIKIYSTALNPVDYKVQQTGVFVEKYPAILGVDMAGVVEDVGEGVQNFAKGDKVSFTFFTWSGSFSHGNFSDDQSSFQQHSIATAEFTAKIPPNFDFDRAATVPLAFDTAAVGLYSEQLGAGLTPSWVEGGQGKYSGKPILIMGGSSAVGSFVIQLARLSGFSPIITTASPAHENHLKSLGATHLIDRHASGDQFIASLNNITKQPIELVYDAISLPETQQAAWAVLSHNGTLVLTLQPVVKEDQGKGRRVVPTYGSPHAQANHALCEASWSILGKWLQDGVIKPLDFEILPNGLHGIPEGLQKMKAGGVSGKKLVAHPQETK